jgi:hypothetical protein
MMVYHALPARSKIVLAHKAHDDPYPKDQGKDHTTRYELETPASLCKRP